MSARPWVGCIQRVGWAGLVAAVAVVVALAWAPGRALAGRVRFGNQVGGVVIDTDGILRAASVDELNQLAKARAEQLRQLPDDVNVATPLRKVSLRRLQAELMARKEKAQMPLVTEEM